MTLPGLPASFLGEYVRHTQTLDLATLSLDAIDPPSLASLLGSAEFEGGYEQRYTARNKPLTEVVARVLSFGTPAGAANYMGWVRAHGADLLGSQAQRAEAPNLSGALAFTHAPCGTCTKDTIQYFTAWTRGSDVLTLLIGGPQAGRAAATPIALQLDTAVKEGT